MAKPHGAVKATEMQMRRPANDKAVFVNVLCQDESGARYYFTAAAFCFDLKPGYPPEISGAAQETCECPFCLDGFVAVDGRHSLSGGVSALCTAANR